MKLNATILVLALSLAPAAVTAHASNSFDGARMISQPDAKHTKAAKGILTLNDTTHNLTFAAKTDSTVIPYGQIMSMRLESSVDRLHAPFTGRVQHEEFLTLTYQDGEGHASFAVFQLKGRSYREVVAALEAQTGKNVELSSN